MPIQTINPATGEVIKTYTEMSENEVTTPASRNNFSIAKAVPVDMGACLSKAPLPAIILGAAKRKTCQKGKFQGIIANITPNG